MTCAREGYVGCVRLPDGRLDLAGSVDSSTVRDGDIGESVARLFAAAGAAQGGGLEVELRWVGLDSPNLGHWAPAAEVAAGDAGTGNPVTVDFIGNDPEGQGTFQIFADVDGDPNTTGDRTTLVDVTAMTNVLLGRHGVDVIHEPGRPLWKAARASAARWLTRTSTPASCSSCSGALPPRARRCATRPRPFSPAASWWKTARSNTPFRGGS